MTKIKAKIVKIEEEPDNAGNVLLKIILNSNGEIYEFAARAEDYADERKRKSINRSFIKSIKARQIENAKSSEEKTKRADAIKALEKTEIEEEVYE